mgnify:CR=1 FL=1
MKTAERPVLYVGGGVLKARGAEVLRRLAEMGDIPVVTTLMARGALPDSHELNLGMPGMHGNYTAVTAIQRSDLLIAMGARFDDRVTGKVSAFAPDAQVIHVDIDPAEHGKVRMPDVSVVGDCRLAMEAMLSELSGDGGAEAFADQECADVFRAVFADGIEAGEIGRAVTAQVTCWLYKPDDYFDVPWRTQPGAGPVFINLIHDVDLMRHLVGEVEAVQASTRNALRGHAVEDTAAAILHFANGALGTVSVSDTVVSPWSWELTAAENPAYPVTDQSCYLIGGTHGALSLPGGTGWTQDEPRGWWEPIRAARPGLRRADPLEGQIAHFARVIAGVEEPLVSAEEGLRSLAVIEAIGRSARSGRVEAVSVE